MTKDKLITRGDFQKLIPDTQMTRTVHDLHAEEDYEIDDSWVVISVEVGSDCVLNIYCQMPAHLRKKYKF